MPKLNTPIHLQMLRRSPTQMPKLMRVARTVRREWNNPGLYGDTWGNPELVPPLKYVKNTYLKPFVRPGTTAVEIGPGGGRWTQYMLSVKRLYAVDYHEELLREHQKNFARPNVVHIKNNGDDFPGIPEHSVDFVFSFGTFVHLDTDIIDRYLTNLHGICKPSTDLVLHYSDKTKVMARQSRGFADNDPERMRAMVEGAGYKIVGEDTTSLWHSSIVHFRPA